MVACTQATPLVDFGRAEIEVGETGLSVAVADTPDLRSRGLRGVEELPGELGGMLFVFESPQPATFVMHDTLIPLDIWWFDDQGLVIGSAEMEPCPAEPCTDYRSPADVRWALETPKGAVELDPGDELIVIDSS